MSCWQAPTPPLPEHMLRAVEEEQEEKGEEIGSAGNILVTVNCNLSR